MGLARETVWYVNYILTEFKFHSQWVVIITQLRRDKNYVPLIVCLDNYKELMFFIMSFGACEIIFVNRSRERSTIT